MDKFTYGLKQSPNAWHARLSSTLKKHGFRSSQAIKSLVIYQQGGITIYYINLFIHTSRAKNMVDLFVLLCSVNIVHAAGLHIEAQVMMILLICQLFPFSLLF
jgi:hypothetical protein